MYFDSKITDRGTKRKKIYTKGGGRKAKQQALKDITIEKNRIQMCKEEIKPFLHKNNTIDYWLKFERATILRFGI